MPSRPEKLSEALLRLARPLLQLHGLDVPSKVLRASLSQAMLVWNAVVLERLGRNGTHLADADAILRGHADGPEQRAIRAAFAEMVATKRAEHPADLRVVASIDLREDGHGGWTLVASEGEPKPGAIDPKGRAAGSKPSKPVARQPNRAVRPTTSDADLAWSALYRLAAEFRALAPWGWMGDAECIGVLDPASGRTDWCVVMGGNGTFHGIAAYRGDEGWHQLQDMLESESPEAETPFGQDALVLGLVDRRGVSEADRARMKGLGFSVRGRNAWPSLESHGIDRLPIGASGVEALRMAQILEQVLDVAERGRGDRELLLPDAQGLRLVRACSIPQAGGLVVWKDERRAPAPRIARPVPEFDQVRAARLRQALPRERFQFECDLFPSYGAVCEKGRPPYVPAVFMIVSASGGEIVKVDLDHPRDREARAQAYLMEMVQELGAIPEALFVERMRLQRVLEPVARALGMRVERVRAAVQVRAAREHMRAHL